MARSILVPLDGSAFSEHALPFALGLARRTDATLHLVLVHEPVFLAEPTGGGVMLSQRMDVLCREQETKYLQEVSARVRCATSQPVDAELDDGGVVDVLLNRIEKKLIDWVVMCTHGRGPLSRFWLGSVADGLVRHSSAPLLLVRPTEGKPDLKQELSIRHILICLDGSPMAESIIDPAISLGKTLGTNFTLFRVVKPAYFQGHDPLRPTEEVFGQPETGQLQQEAQRYLTELTGRLAPRNVKVGNRVAVAEQIAQAILDQSQQQPGTMIAMATHGRGGFARALLGSVTDKVLRGSTGPMLVYRPQSPSSTIRG